MAQTKVKIRQPKQKRRQLHQSGVTMFNRCGQQFAYRYIQGIRRPPSAFMLCGSATDKGVNYDLDTKIVTGELAKLDEITDIAAQSVEKDDRRDALQLDEEDLALGKSPKQVIGETKDRAVRLVTLHHGEIAPRIQPWRTARQFTVNLDKFLRARGKLLHEEAEMPDLSEWRRKILDMQGSALIAMSKQGIDFVGEQDIVEKFKRYDDGPEVLNIRDTKTSKSRKNQQQVDADDQLTAYAASEMVVDGRLPDKLMFDVLVETAIQQKQSTQIIETTRTEADVDVYLNRIANAIVGLKLGVFAPTNQTNWWCSTKYCGYAHMCPYFRRTERPGNVVMELGPGAGQSNDLLPILKQSVAEVVRKTGVDEEEETKL